MGTQLQRTRAATIRAEQRGAVKALDELLTWWVGLARTQEEIQAGVLIAQKLEEAERELERPLPRKNKRSA